MAITAPPSGPAPAPVSTDIDWNNILLSWFGVAMTAAGVFISGWATWMEQQKVAMRAQQRKL